MDGIHELIEEHTKLEGSQDLYQHFNKYDYWQLMDLFDKATTKEEQDFYAAVSDIALQRRQAKVIKEENPDD